MSEDRNYLLDRAESELEAARAARHPRAASAHFHLAGLLFDRFFGSRREDRRPILSLNFESRPPAHAEPAISERVS